ncbi:predicted protein [Nematostella vectensis]|uniref:G-protein coupled receptors family 1 profile domain-containing protein n=1 Tax=Nematostella vectensis TaxID=45351 RepID=A7SZK1_NEMVE|nr:predicted protein [Nematostella vectensis]|eukprot:XP_001622970.1 predicted protein [Nematostella vectensis]
MYTIVFLGSLIGNSVVVRVIQELNKMIKRPITYYLITNLALAELLGTSCMLFFRAYVELRSWPFGDVMCRILNAMLVMSYAVVPATLAAIAILRYRLIVSRPIPPSSEKRTFLLMAALWGVGMGICLPSFLTATVVQSPLDEETYWCIELFPGDTLEDFPSQKLKRFFLVRFMLNFACPGIIMVAAYGALACKLRLRVSTRMRCDKCKTNLRPLTTTSVIYLSLCDHERHLLVQVQEHRNSPTPPISMIVVTSPSSEALEHAGSSSKSTDTAPEQNSMERDLLRMIYAIIVIYLVCYLPYQIFFLLEYFKAVTPRWRYFDVTREYLYLITCFPSALHPLCYGTMCPFYAMAFSRLILCKKTR